MHEMMVAQSLLAAISSEAAKHSSRPVAVKISCGKLYAINDEALCFAFSAICEGTVCQGVKLEIEHKAMQARCRDCGQIGEIEFPVSSCSKCAGENIELLPDAPLLLEEIEFETG